MISFPDNAPLGDDQKKQLSSVIAGLSSEQRAWVSGYLAGSNSQAQEKAPATTSASQPVTVLYGTESGNSEALAGKLAKQAKQKGYKPNK